MGMTTIDLDNYFVDIYIRYRRPKVIHLRPTNSADRYKVLGLLRGRQVFFKDVKLWCGLDRTKEKRDRIRQVRQVLVRKRR